MARAAFQVLVVPYRIVDQALQVAVFKRADYQLWQFVSGGGEDDETPEAAAVREAQEEAGITADRGFVRLDSQTTIPACWFSCWDQWPRSLLMVPEYAFAVDVGSCEIQLSREHTQFAWVDYEEAMARLRFDSNRNALWELRERLFPGPRIKRPAYA